MVKKQIFRIGIKNFPAAHGGVEAATYNFVQATKDKYDFTIFTVWDNPTVKNNEVDGVRVYQLAKGWLGRFWQIRGAVTDKKNTVLHFHMEIFIPLAIVFSLLGYNVVSSLHGLSWHNKKMTRSMHWIIRIVDILGVNLVRRSMYVAKHNYDTIKHYTFRRIYHIPNGSKECPCVNDKPSKDIVFIGRISVQKNVLNLIDAAEHEHRNVDLFGPIDEREVEHTRQFKEKLSTAKYVRWLGTLKPEEIYPTLSQYKAFVNPSWAEASPNAVIEAGACGLYLYLSDVPGHRNVAFPDVYYFPPKEISIPRLPVAEKRSIANIKHHREELSLAKNIERYSELYASFH